MSEEQLKVVREYIDDHLKKGFIRESTSPYRSGVLLAPKKNRR